MLNVLGIYICHCAKNKDNKFAFHPSLLVLAWSRSIESKNIGSFIQNVTKLSVAQLLNITFVD